MTVLAFIIGALISTLALWLLRTASTATLAFSGLFLFGAMLAVYVGAYLTHPDATSGFLALAGSTVVFAASGLLLRLWPATIGGFILAHGVFDHFFGLHAGLPHWYPPFCLGVDVVAGAGLIWLLRNKRMTE